MNKSILTETIQQIVEEHDLMSKVDEFSEDNYASILPSVCVRVWLDMSDHEVELLSTTARRYGTDVDTDTIDYLEELSGDYFEQVGTLPEIDVDELYDLECELAEDYID